MSEDDFLSWLSRSAECARARAIGRANEDGEMGHLLLLSKVYLDACVDSMELQMMRIKP